MTYTKKNDLMIDTKLLKIIGLYQILNSNTVKLFGYNIFRFISVIQILIYLMTIIALVLNVYYCADDIYWVANYFALITAFLLVFVKLYCTIKNADRLWNCVKSTSTKCLSYEYHDNRIIETGRTKSKLFSTVVICFYTTLVTAWLFSPFLTRNYTIEVKFKNEIYHYRYNVFNLVYPVSDRFYNDNYESYYVLEMILGLMMCHSSMIFDVLIISICVTLSYQLKTIANSYTTFDVTHNNLTASDIRNINRNELVTSLKYKKSNSMINFRMLIKDQQNVIENLRNIYNIFKPALIYHIGSDSFEIILLSQVTIMNYMNGLTLISWINLKFIFTIITNVLHLFFVCYFFNNTNDHKDSLNFAIYSCGWTERSIHFKKLLLYGMRMNAADSQRLQVTMKKKVNLELFSSVVQTTYSILSVSSKQYEKKSKFQ